MNRDPEVDRWFEERDEPIDGAMQRARGDPRRRRSVTESIKWKTPTYSFEGNIASFNPSKRFVASCSIVAEIPGDHPRLEGDGKLARTMRFADVADVDAGRGDLGAVIKAWCDWKGT